jgi:DNA-binding IclR family transcriptional regulator
VAVLEFLASRPDERFTLSEVARECHLNKATAHALLTELTGRGVLLRHPDEKRYSLGPRLVPIGQAAGQGYQLEDFAPGVLRDLAGSTGAPAAALVHDTIDDHAVVVAQHDGGRSGPLPSRWPLVPPTGAVFFAWADDPSVEAWLARCPAGGSVRQALDGLAAVRRDRFMVGAAVPAWRKLVALLQEAQSNHSSGPHGAEPADRENEAQESLRDAQYELSRSRALLTEIEPDIPYEVAYVAAPVFDHTGAVALAVVSGTRGDQVVLRGRQLRELASAVAFAADQLTEAAFGRRPW